MSEFDTKHHFSSGVYMKQMKLTAGFHVKTHKHNYDHFGLLAKGSALVELDDITRVYNGPCPIEIKAGKHHKITAITDIDWFCIHATEITDPEQVDKVLIEEN